MILKSGTIIPFIFEDVKKLIAIPSLNKNEKLQLNDVETAIYSAFENLKKKYEFYNLKIGFQIPKELFILYLEQRHDLTNFVVKIVETDEIRVGEGKQQNPLQEPQKSIERNACNERDGSDVSPKHIKTLKQNSMDPYLGNIFKISTKGRAIFKNFVSSNSKKLCEEDRVALAKLVINFEFKNLVKSRAPIAIDTKRLANLSYAIVRSFPGEDPSEYFVEHSKSFKYIAGGKLYEYFLQKKLHYAIQMERNYLYLSAPEGTIEADFPELKDLEETTGNWQSFFRAWQYTFELRMAYFRNAIYPIEYFEKLISSVRERTNDLVEYDFERLHPKKSNNLFDNWDQLSERIFTEALINGHNGVALILDTYGHMSELSGLMILSYFYENYEREVCPFKKDYPGNLVIHIESEEGEPEKFFNDYYYTEEPTVFALGKTEDLKYYVVFGGNLFHMETVLTAVDFCFKCYRVLRMSYQSAQSPSWQLIQNAFYDIYTDDDSLATKKFLKLLKNE